MRGPVAFVALVVFSITILAPGSAAVPQGRTRSPELALGGEQLLARTNARREHVKQPYSSRASESRELVWGLALQGLLFLVLGFLWTIRSRRREALPKSAGRQESMMQPVTATDVENSPASVVSISS